MKALTLQLELITPCFCGGAEPDKQAEIRAPSIRGQLRWWFRTLGGFKSLASQNLGVRRQEDIIFGATAGDKGRAGRLIVRVSPPTGHSLTESADHVTPDMASPEGYLLFPLRQKARKKSALPAFTLHLVWRGEHGLCEDISALGAIFAQLGSLGFRGRRAMGALSHRQGAPNLKDALNRFNNPQGVQVHEIKLPCGTAAACMTELAKWLKSWRQHGRTPQLATREPGFDYARRDHNEGLERLTGNRVAGDPPGHQARGRSGETFRPVLGLPIIQFFSSQPQGRNKVNWDFGTGNAKGRFASPVLLRPHRDAQGKWHALVIFVDAHKWPNDPATGQPNQVFLDGQPRNVSLDLYKAMKADKSLQPYP